MRCLAIAEAMKSAGWRIVFFSSRMTAATAPALAAAGYDFEVLSDDADDAQHLSSRLAGGADLLVVDHYRRDAAFERACRPWSTLR